MEIDSLKKKFQHGDGLHVEFDGCDVNSVCDLLKRFIRDIPTFLHKSVTPHFENHTIASIKEGLLLLDPTTRATLAQIVRLLSEVSKHSEKNKMSSQNLAIVFAPNFRLNFGSTGFLIENYSKLFCNI